MLNVLENPPMSLPPFAYSGTVWLGMGMQEGILSQRKGGEDMAPKMAADPQNVHNMVMVGNAVNSI